MEITIVAEKENKLLNRREVVFEITHPGEPTPSRMGIKEKLAAKLTVDDKMVVVHPLESKYGSSLMRGIANIYRNEEGMKVELAPIIKRNTKVEPKKEDAPAESPAKALKEEPKTEGRKEGPKKEGAEPGGKKGENK